VPDTDDRSLASRQRSLDVFQATYLYQTRQRPTLPGQSHPVYKLTRFQAEEVASHMNPLYRAKLIAEDTLEVGYDLFAPGFVKPVTPVAPQASYTISQWRRKEGYQRYDNQSVEEFFESAYDPPPRKSALSLG
jgi:hypothetical protein